MSAELSRTSPARDALPQPGALAGTAMQEGVSCPICGFVSLEWIRCKLLCRNCRTIVMSCGDL